MIKKRVNRENNFKYTIIEEITKSVKALVIDKEFIQNVKVLDEFNSEESIYFFVKDAKYKCSLEFLFNNAKDEVELNKRYSENEKDILPSLYIGQTKDTSRRYINHHIEDYNYAIIIISKFKKGFVKEERLYLEKYYYSKYKNNVNCMMLNGPTPQGSRLNQELKLKTFQYITDINYLLSYIDKDLFNVNAQQFIIDSKGIQAYISKVNGYYVVSEGSEAVKEITKSSKNKSLDNKRKLLIDSGILKLDKNKYVFTKSYVFKSVSGVAEAVLGNSRSGEESLKSIF